MFSETFVINGYYLLEKPVSQILKLTYWHFLVAVESGTTASELSAIEHHWQ